MKIRTKKCLGCGADIRVAERSVRKYCSEKCRKTASYKDSTLGFAPGVVGALSELVAAADLLRKGYEVYRAVSPHSSSDLMVSKDGKTLRIEVRTAREYKTGTLHYSRARFRSDHYALVVDNKVTYIPELETQKCQQHP